MSETTTATEIAIDFGAIEGQDTAPKSAVDSTLSQVTSTGALETFSCRAVLKPAQLEQVRALAQREYGKMLTDSTVLSNFGTSSLNGVNQTVARILQEQTKLEIPEVSHMTRELNQIVSGFRDKYNPSDPQVQKVFATFDQWKQTIGKFFRAGRSLLDDLYEDSLTVAKSLDRSAGKLVANRQQLQRNVLLCDELYAQNETAIGQLVGVIAIMEEVRDLALEQAKALQPKIDASPENSPERRSFTEQQQVITELANDVEIRISEFTQRLFVAWTTSPQIRNIRKISYGLDQRLGLLIQLTIPTLKMTVAVWGTLVQAEQAGKQKDAIDDLTNEALTGFASAAATAVPKVAKTIQTPSIKPETITAMADSIVTQNEGLVEAVAQGQQQRAQVVNAIVQAGRRITESTRATNEEIIDLITNAQKPLSLPPAPEVPDLIKEVNEGM